MTLGPCAFHLDRYKQEVPAVRVVAGSPMCADCFDGSGEDEPAERIMRPRKKRNWLDTSIGGPIRQAVRRLKQGAREVKVAVPATEKASSVQKTFHRIASEPEFQISVQTSCRGRFVWAWLKEK